MKIADIMDLLKCFGSAGAEDVESILEKIPVYGGLMSEIVKTAKKGYKRYIELYPDREISEEEKREILLEELKKAIKEKEASEGRPPYMDCVIYLCRKGYLLSEEQKEDISLVLEQEMECSDEESQKIIDLFIDEYMGGNLDVDNVDECSIGDDYIEFNFCDVDEHKYDEEDLKLIMKALNGILGEEVFDFYHADGHTESWNE